MINTLAIAFIEQLMNRSLKLDPQTFQRAKSFAGKVIFINITDLHFRFYLLFSPQGVRLLKNFSTQPDSRITATSLTLLRQAIQTAPSSDLNIEGDIELGQEIRDMFQSMDIDWEEKLSRFTGDTVAHHVGSATRKFISWGKNLSNNFSHDLTDYLQQETQLLPTEFEINEFFKEVNELRYGVERLEAKIPPS